MQIAEKTPDAKPSAADVIQIVKKNVSEAQEERTSSLGNLKQALFITMLAAAALFAACRAIGWVLAGFMRQ